MTLTTWNRTLLAFALLAFGAIACGPPPKPRRKPPVKHHRKHVAPKKPAHPGHEHAHAHPHGDGGHHHHPHPHPHLAGQAGHHHPF